MYRQYFTPDEIHYLDSTPLDDVSSEINLLRVLLDRLLDAARRTGKLELKDHADILEAINGAGWSLACLVRLYAQRHDPLRQLNLSIALTRTRIALKKGIHELRRHAQAAQDLATPFSYATSYAQDPQT